jgi:uncharacterized protein (DUF952 family)
VGLSQPASVIFHIARRDEWESARPSGTYKADTLSSEGFIHCSERHQVVGVANRLYRNRSDLLLLCVDPTRLTSELRYEPGGGDTFPHIYGPLNVSAVTRVVDFPPRSDGSFDLPPDL